MIKGNELNVTYIDLSYRLKKVPNSYVLLSFGTSKNCSYLYNKCVIMIQFGSKFNIFFNGQVVSIKKLHRVTILAKAIEYWSVTSSNFLFVFQHFHDYILVVHDEEPSHTKFDMNWFMVARDMVAWIPNYPNWKQCKLAWFITVWNQVNLHWFQWG